MKTASRRSQMFIIFVIVFIDLAGFGMILPLSSYLAKNYGATAFEVGLLMTIYSLMQFIFSPFWGRLSDRFGRRPILLMSILLSGFSYIGFSFSTSLWMLFFWRAMSGIFTANISTAMAYIADITEEKDRSKSMGLIGAAFGLGFMTGPALGGVLGEIGTHISSVPPFGINFAAFVAGCLALCNFVFAFKVLSESLSAEQMAHPRERKSRIGLLFKNLSRPVVGVVLSLTFLSVFSMAHMESTIFLYVIDKFGWSMRFTSFGFAYIGLIMVITQGYLIRKLLPRFGERKLLVVGFLLVAIGIGGIVFVTGAWSMALTQTFLALGIGLINPSLSGSISLLVAKHEQGEILGVNQSMSALGRIIGPALGGFLFGRLSIYSPYIFASALMLLGMLIAIKIYSRLPEKGKEG